MINLKSLLISSLAKGIKALEGKKKPARVELLHVPEDSTNPVWKVLSALKLSILLDEESRPYQACLPSGGMVPFGVSSCYGIPIILVRWKLLPDVIKALIHPRAEEIAFTLDGRMVRPALWEERIGFCMSGDPSLHPEGGKGAFSECFAVLRSDRRMYDHTFTRTSDASKAFYSMSPSWNSQGGDFIILVSP